MLLCGSSSARAIGECSRAVPSDDTPSFLFLSPAPRLSPSGCRARCVGGGECACRRHALVYRGSACVAPAGAGRVGRGGGAAHARSRQPSVFCFRGGDARLFLLWPRARLLPPRARAVGVPSHERVGGRGEATNTDAGALLCAALFCVSVEMGRGVARRVLLWARLAAVPGAPSPPRCPTPDHRAGAAASGGGRVESGAWGADRTIGP